MTGKPKDEPRTNYRNQPVSLIVSQKSPSVADHQQDTDQTGNDSALGSGQDDSFRSDQEPSWYLHKMRLNNWILACLERNLIKV